MNGSPCLNNNISSFCDCPATSFPTADDFAVFRVGNNCAIVTPALIAAYVLAIVSGVAIGFASLRESFLQTKRINRAILRSNTMAAWITALFCIAHWLEGYRFGIYSTLVFSWGLCHFNLQIGVVEYMVFSIFFRMSASRHDRLPLLRKHLTIWTLCWLVVKVIPLAVLLYAVVVANDRVYNKAMLAVIINVFAETIAQSLMSALVFTKLYRSLVVTSNSSQLTGMAAEKRLHVEVFAKKILGQIHIIWGFLLVMVALSVTILGLAIHFEQRVPYAWIPFAVYIVSWPTLAIGPIGLFRERLLKSEMPSAQPPIGASENNNKSNNLSNNRQVAVPQNMDEVEPGLGANHPPSPKTLLSVPPNYALRSPALSFPTDSVSETPPPSSGFHLKAAVEPLDGGLA